MNWSTSAFNQPPTMDGISTLLETLSRPIELANITDMSDRWLSAIIAMSAHGAHSDNDHLRSDRGFHPLTAKHFLSNTFEGMTNDDKQAASRERANHLFRVRKLIYDLCTVLDRLSGGVTLCLHHPGATAPLTDLQPQDLSVSLYLNPRLLTDPLQCHQPIAEITQMFVEGCALPVAQSFRDARLAHGWKQELRRSSSDIPDYDSLPLVPLPSSGTGSSDFNILGRPFGCLEHVISTQRTTDSMLPFLSTSTSSATPTIRWTNQQITLSRHAPSRDRALDLDLVTRPTYTTTPTVTPARSTSRTVHVARTPSKPPQSHVSSGISPLPLRMSSGVSPLPSRMSSGAPPLPSRTPLGASSASSPTRSTNRSVPLVSSSSQSGSMYSIPKELLLPFGPNTHATLEELGYSDTLHNTCREVFNSCVPDRWASELAKRGNISSKPEALQISAAMKGPKLSREARQALTTRQREKRADEDAAVDDILTYIDEQATDLARRFGRSRRRYLEKLYIGSALRRKRRNKTSAWSTFLHFKSEKFNADKDIGQRANLRAIAKETSEYHQLTLEQRAEMVEEFEKIKTPARNESLHRTRLAEVNASFAAMVSEAEALKERVGTETLIVTVRSSSNLNMLPKVHLTSDVVSHFVRTLLREDPMKLGIKMESTVLAGLAPRNVLSMNYSDRKLAAKQGIRSGLNESLVEVTENANATLEFVRYERMVQEHLVKLIGWCHNEWGNPSNLKGGVGPLEALALAVSDKKCKFIRITRQEADERMKRIEAGEVLTPNKVDQEPEESPIDDDDTYEGNDIGGSADQTDHLPLPTPSSPTTPPRNNDLGPADQTDHLPLPTPSSPTTPTHNNDLGPAPRTSEITEDLIDPALLGSYFNCVHYYY
ncbi:hypothetical protein F4604DRAFT_1591386 [Suillus subluteus]|nr:hypothetical protein F4604DRAFT_1591386 [Suillus subluteus]